jgi:hypothetical protein
MPDPTLWTRDQFLRRFTDAERLALHRLSLKATNAGAAAALALQVFYSKSYIASTSTTLVEVLDFLVAQNVITEARKQAILNPAI